MIHCPNCGGEAKTLKALETRSSGKGVSAFVRRRRECALCHRRVTTYEVIVEDGETGADLMVVQRPMLEQVLRLIIKPLAARSDPSLVEDLLERLLGGPSS